VEDARGWLVASGGMAFVRAVPIRCHATTLASPEDRYATKLRDASGTVPTRNANLHPARPQPRRARTWTTGASATACRAAHGTNPRDASQPARVLIVLP